MHEDYEDNDYDDSYDDSQDYQEDFYKHYFKFDPEAWDIWSKLLNDVFKTNMDQTNNVWYAYGYLPTELPVNSYFSNAGKNNSYQYLGTNYDNVKIWKKKYFIIDPIQHQYIKHLEYNAAYFLKQPHYYKGLFDILN
jgi:hypothetical protein